MGTWGGGDAKLWATWRMSDWMGFVQCDAGCLGFHLFNAALPEFPIYSHSLHNALYLGRESLCLWSNPDCMTSGRLGLAAIYEQTEGDSANASSQTDRWLRTLASHWAPPEKVKLRLDQLAYSSALKHRRCVLPYSPYPQGGSGGWHTFWYMAQPPNRLLPPPSISHSLFFLLWCGWLIRFYSRGKSIIVIAYNAHGCIIVQH